MYARVLVGFTGFLIAQVGMEERGWRRGEGRGDGGGGMEEGGGEGGWKRGDGGGGGGRGEGEKLVSSHRAYIVILKGAVN